MENPLLNVLNLEFIPYSKIKNSDYLPAFEYAISKANESISELINKQKEEKLDLKKFENSTDLFDQIKVIYNNKRRVNSLDEEGLQTEKINNLISKFESSIYMNKDLYSKFKSLDINSLNLQEKAAYNYHMRKFLENGYVGDLADQTTLDRLKEINSSLSNLISSYETNLIKATDAFHINITNEDDMKEFPEKVKISARKLSQEKGYESGYCFSLQAPSYSALMMYCSNRDIRKKMYYEVNHRCNGGEFSNIEIMKKILELRKEKAKLLGFKSYNEFVLSNRMAKEEKNVYNLLDMIREKALIKAKKDYNELLDFVQKNIDKNITKIERWDTAYYIEKFKKHTFNLNSEDLRKFFPLSKVTNILFDLIEHLYGINYTLVPNEHLYHPDIKIYKMQKNKNIPIGCFYLDLYPRKEKTMGGWVYPLKPRVINNYPPIVGIIANQRKPVNENEEAFLSLGEAETVFHESGHSLHITLNEMDYKSISDLNVLWDFVECPSQFMENFFYEKNILEKFEIPEDIIEKIKKLKNLFESFWELSYINRCYVDMKLHSNEFDSSMDVEEFENKFKVDIFENLKGTTLSLFFSHLFNATYDYSCGYYSYHWAEILACDAFEDFKDGKEVEAAERFRKHILSQGGIEDPNILFKRFKGKEFSIEPFLKSKGLID
jgi:peptidyl-dipeptidase Dcp